ncbi:MAG: hypothetical protein KDA78_15260 [Planctomycetaceae bacterium]|nr:hypothetical protein [Planctomycetaceae bacterium]
MTTHGIIALAVMLLCIVVVGVLASITNQFSIWSETGKFENTESIEQHDRTQTQSLSDVLESMEPPTEKEYLRIRAQVDQQLSSIKDHPWAGIYTHSEFENENQGWLAISPDNLFYCTYSLAGYLLEKNCGEVRFEDGRLVFKYLFDEQEYGKVSETSQLQIVNWGARRYLVQDENMIGFCADCVNNFEPRTTTDSSNLCFLRVGDESKSVSGLPQVPAEYLDYLPSQPIAAQITQIEMTRPDENSHPNEQQEVSLVTLNAGTLAGIVEGMELFKVKGDLYHPRIKVLTANEATCQAEVHHPVGYSQEHLKEWVFSTHHAKQ